MIPITCCNCGQHFLTDNPKDRECAKCEGSYAKAIKEVKAGLRKCISCGVLNVKKKSRSPKCVGCQKKSALNYTRKNSHKYKKKNLKVMANPYNEVK